MQPQTFTQWSRDALRIAAPALALLLSLAYGCAPTRSGVAVDPEQRNHELSEGYALLYNLLEENRRVNLATRIPFRSVSDPTRNLLNDLARASGDAADQLYDLANVAPDLGLNDEGLPTLESATRDAIASTTQRDLLAGDRDRFELYLLLAQAEATRYASHLAGQLAEAETHQARHVFLNDVQERFDQLHERVLERLAVQQ